MSNEIGNDSFENLLEEDRKNIDILSTAIAEFAVEVEKAVRVVQSVPSTSTLHPMNARDIEARYLGKMKRVGISRYFNPIFARNDCTAIFT